MPGAKKSPVTEIDKKRREAEKALLRLAGLKGSKLIADDGRGRKLYEVKVTTEFRIKHFVNGLMPLVDGLELKDKSSVTGNVYDDGYILIDNREQLAARRAATAGAQAAPAAGAQGAAPAEPEFTTIKTVYGDSVTVRTADLNSDKPRLRQYTKDGKSKAVPAIHRDNLDLTGEKSAERAKENAKNLLFHTVTTKDGGAFASQAAAQREVNRLGLQDSHEVVEAGGGFVGRIKKTGEQHGATARNLRLADERTPGAGAAAPHGPGESVAGEAPVVGAGQRQTGDAEQPGTAVRAVVPDAAGASQPDGGVGPAAQQESAAKKTVAQRDEETWTHMGQDAADPQAEAAQPATPQRGGNDFLPEGWTKSVNGFTKRPVYRMEQGVGQPFAVVTQTEGMTYEVQIRHGDKQLTTGAQRGALSEVLAAAEAELGRMTQADSVTHADPGEKAEAATPAVVTDSLKKAASNEDTKPSEMRKWLVAEIDKELLQAPDRADYDEAVKRLGEKDAISMFTGNGPLGKNSETGFITFDVPGDGKYKVRNSVRGLLEFRKNVMASQGFKDSGQKQVKPEQNRGVQGGSGGSMAAITNMIEEGDFEAARDYAEAVGIKLEDVKVPRGDMKPAWEKYLKDGTLPPAPDTRPQPAPKTAAQQDEEKRQAAEAEAKKPKDTGWNMAGTGYGGKRYIGRNITLDDGREVVARVYENAGTYEEAEVKVDGVRKFTVTDRDNAQGKADAFIRTLQDGDQAAGSAKSPTRVTPQISGNPEKFIKVAADSVRELRSVDVDRVLTETPVQFRAEVASYIRDQRKDLADEVDDVMADIQPMAAAPAPAPATTGARRDPAKVSMFNPYNDGDIVTIDGQDWTVKADTPGWYLTTTGNWRGQHPTIRNVKAMADLIREVEQAAEAKPASAGRTYQSAYDAEVERMHELADKKGVPASGINDDLSASLASLTIGRGFNQSPDEFLSANPAQKGRRDAMVAWRNGQIDHKPGQSEWAKRREKAQPAAESDTPKLTQSEAKELMEWQDLGQKDGVKTHALTFYESQADKDAKRGRMIVAKVTKGDRSASNWMVDGDDKPLAVLGMAKKRAEDAGMARLVADGYVGEAPTTGPKPARITPDIAANMKAGDVVVDEDGKEYRANAARHGWLEAHPIVDGKAQVNADSRVMFHLDPQTASAYPERSHKAVFLKEEAAEANPLADYNALAQEYGFEVRPDGAIGSDGKFPGPKMKVKGGRLRIESGSGDLLASYASPAPQSLGKFLESFWYAQKKADGGVEATAAKPAGAAKPAAAPQPEAPAAPITDFGEKIGGARKDVWSGFKDDLNKVLDDDIAGQPLTKVWPAPDYKKLIDAGMNAKTVAAVRALRDEVPAKPRAAWKVKRWAEQVKTLRGLANDVMDGKITVQDMERMGANKGTSLRGMMGRIELYELVGHEKSLEGVRFAHHHYALYKGRENVSLWVVEKDAGATAFSNWPREIAIGDTKEQALASFKEKYAGLDLEKAVRKASFDIFSERGSNAFYVGKKIGRNYAKLEGPFNTVKEAREYREKNLAALEAKLEKYKEIPRERADVNQPRVGVDMRNGQDVTPQMFGEVFGFRGVEFGNWVEQKRRQKDLNDAFDALMDMAAVLDIPPKAISLNGQLGLAFGARGSGGVNPAAAHYEPDNVVINLTKKEGAGSLGHEWWHALDNYFAKQRKVNRGSFMTTGTDVGLAARGKDYYYEGGIRQEMIDAFGAVVKAINLTAMKARASTLDGKRTKDYWTTGEEMSARAFESYLISKLQDQNASNDYLANVVSEKTWDAMAALGMENENSYPYPTAAEIPAIRAGFDHFFQTVETREDDAGNVSMFSSADSTPPAKPLSLNRVNQLVQEALSGIRGAPPVEVTARPADVGLKVPAGSVGYGVTLRSGDIYVFQSAMGSDLDVFKTVFHELFHRGVRVLVPKGQYVQTMLDLAKGDSRIQQLAIEWKNTEMGQKQKDNLRKQGYTGAELTGQYEALAIEEALAAVAEEIKAEGRLGSKPKNMTIRFLANWLAKLADLAGMKKLAQGIRNMSYNEAERFVMSAIDRSGEPVQAGRTDNLSAKQVKSAIGNNGNFDPADGRIDHFGANRPAKDGTPTDRAVMDMTRDGKSAQDILRLIAGTSRSRFNRQVARLLLRTGVAPKVEALAADGLGKDKRGFNLLAKYSRDSNTISLTEGAGYMAEQIMLHELIHAATLRALDRKGLASLQMRRLFEHVQKHGGLAGTYGMKNVGEFTSEAFTNPEFQRALRQIAAPPGGRIKAAWDGFVRILRSILGLPQSEHSALSQALELGVAVMREDMALRQRGVVARGRDAQAGIDQTQTEAFKRWFKNSKVVDADGKPLVVYHGTASDFSVFDGSKSNSRSMTGVPMSSFVFSTSPEAAGTYAGRFDKQGWDTPANQDRWQALWDAGKIREASKFMHQHYGTRESVFNPGSLIMPVYLSIKNPLIVDAKGAIWKEIPWRGKKANINGLAEFAKKQGHDGLIVRNVRDQATGTDAAIPADTVFAFHPEQIKSAIGNNGNFDPEDADIAHFGAAELARNMGEGLKSITRADVRQAGRHKLTDWLKYGLQFLGRRQLVDIYDKVLPMREYDRLAAQMEADKNETGANADDLARRWGKLPDEGKLADLMHDATLAQIDADSDVAAASDDDRAKATALKARFKSLTPEAQQVYRQARDSYSAHHAQVREAIRARIMRSELGSAKREELLKRMDDDFFKKVKGVYFPLARFGKYAVTVKGPEGKVESVSRAETKDEAEALRSNLLAAFPRDKGFTVGRVMLSKDFIADRDAVGRGFMTELYQVLDKQDIDAAQRAELEDTLGQLYLSSLPDLSWAKHGIHRKGTPGFSQDARRAFAQNMFHGARYLAKLRYSDLMQDELAAMQKHVDDWREVEDFDQNSAQRVVDEMNKRHESLMNPKSNPLSTALTSLGFVFHLGLSPASAMVNLSQTALVAYPIMGAKWGFGKASAALLKASKQAAAGKNDITGSLNADERAAYDEAVRAGTIDVTMAHDLAGIAQGEDAGVMWKLRPVMRWASFLFHHAERFNRQVTFVAAYRLARDAGANHKVAFDQATKATYDGHFDYGAANRPRIMQGNVAKVLLLFKQYGQNMVYTLSRNAYQSIKGTDAEKTEARKALAGLLTSHAMAAGVLGLPMVTTLLAAASMLGGDDDEPWDAKVALQNMLADAFGQKPAEVLAHGLSRLTPWDISGRVGLDRLIFPDVQEGLEGQRLAESAMAAALGPVAGIGVNVLKGAQHMSEGRYAMGLEAMLPSALRGPVKALRYAEEGVQDKSGISILDQVSPAAVAGQALGFSPSAARNAQEGKSAILAYDRALGERRQELLTKIARATMAKDEEAKAEAREEIKRFNEKNPGRRINPNHIMASVHGRQKRINQAQDGVYLPRNRREAMEVGRFALAESE